MEQPIVFAYYVNGELMGFRADSFGSLSLKRPKIYHYTESQVDVIKNNTKNELSKSGTSFMKYLFEKNDKFTPMNMNGDTLEKSSIVSQIEKTEDEKREWGEFELRIIPFIGYEQDWEYPEQWKIDAEIANLKSPLEVHKFTTLNFEN